MSQGAAWVDRAMQPLVPFNLPTSEYNDIYSAVQASGPIAGNRLVQSLVRVLQRRAPSGEQNNAR